MTPHYQDDQVAVYHGDCLDVLLTLPDASVDAVVCDPPYDLTAGKKGGTGAASVNLDSPYGRSRIGTGNGSGGFMGAKWDATGVAFDPATWREVLRVLKPGGHMLAFGGTRTWHRLACAVEDAGFEIRDSIAWMYGSGFPKSLDVSKAIDKAVRGVPQGGVDPTSRNHGKYRTTATEGKRWDGDSGQGYGAGGSRFLADGAGSGSDTEPAASGVAEIAPEAQCWQGWGTALKPAFEPIVVARKPLAGTVAANVQRFGTGALNIDACRIETGDTVQASASGGAPFGAGSYERGTGRVSSMAAGRWPANVVLDEYAARELDQQSGTRKSGAWNGNRNTAKTGAVFGEFESRNETPRESSEGGASRFFYTAKAAQHERPTVDGTAHPTVKPVSLMSWLVRLVVPPGGVVLDPFAGTGTTGEAAILEHKRCILIEREAEYLPLIVARLRKPMQVGFDFEAPA